MIMATLIRKTFKWGGLLTFQMFCPLSSMQGALQLPGRYGAGEVVESPTFWRQYGNQL